MLTLKDYFDDTAHMLKLFLKAHWKQISWKEEAKDAFMMELVTDTDISVHEHNSVC